MTKVIVLARRGQGISRNEFRAHLHGVHAELVAQLPGLRHVMFNEVLPDPSGAEAPYDLIGEDWFESPEAMQAAFSSPQGQAAMADVPNFLDPAQLHVLVVEEHEVPLEVRAR
jgi:uncharacterized protein (TIGR02118 family)